MDAVDVVVVGAGPVGMLTAIELAVGGARVLVLERLDAPSAALKAGGIGALGLEALQRRGMGAAVAEAQALALSARARTQSGTAGKEGGPRYSGHFAGLVLIRSDVQREPNRRGAFVDQPTVETILADRAATLGIVIRRGCEVERLEQGDDGATVAWRETSGEGRARCSWLVGCDGGRSRVRKMAGFAFPGCDPTMTMIQAVARLDHPERLEPGFVTYTTGGIYMAVGERLVLLDFSGPPKDRHAPVTREEFEALLRQISGADVRVVSVEHASRWTDNTRLVESYRQGRVLLAGDAAHIHSPFGGQGLSLGLVDAQNLGWKLAAVVRGDMPETLLDSYTAERRPVAEAVLANTLAQVAIMRPDPQSAAMRSIVAKLMGLDDANRFFGAMMSSLDARYDLGSPREDVGMLAADRDLGGRSLYDLMQDGGGVFLDAGDDPEASGLAAAAGVRRAAIAAGPSMLLRPDACVAWAGEDRAGLEDALRRWFKADLIETPPAMPAEGRGRPGAATTMSSAASRP